MVWKNNDQDRDFIDALRVVLGKEPLYETPLEDTRHGKTRYGSGAKPHGQYFRLEALTKRADPDCNQCEGAGYTMGAANDPEFPCRCLSAEVSA